MVKDNNSTGYLFFFLSGRGGGSVVFSYSDFFFPTFVHVTTNVPEPVGERKKKGYLSSKDHTDKKAFEGRGTVRWVVRVTSVQVTWNVMLAPHLTSFSLPFQPPNPFTTTVSPSRGYHPLSEARFSNTSLACACVT